jgi:hypothetical protein
MRATGSSRLILGVPNAADPAVYNLQSLTMTGASMLKVVGPVILNVAGEVDLHGTAGDPARPAWLRLEVAAGGVKVHAAGALAGSVTAPSGVVAVSGTIVGRVVSDSLVVNRTGVVRVEK